MGQGSQRYTARPYTKMLSRREKEKRGEKAKTLKDKALLKRNLPPQ